MEDREEPGEMFDKEDMSDMFSRAMLEKMQEARGQTVLQVTSHMILLRPAAQ